METKRISTLTKILLGFLFILLVLAVIGYIVNPHSNDSDQEENYSKQIYPGLKNLPVNKNIVSFEKMNLNENQHIVLKMKSIYVTEENLGRNRLPCGKEIPNIKTTPPPVLRNIPGTDKKVGFYISCYEFASSTVYSGGIFDNKNIFISSYNFQKQLYGIDSFNFLTKNMVAIGWPQNPAAGLDFHGVYDFYSGQPQWNLGDLRFRGYAGYDNDTALLVFGIGSRFNGDGPTLPARENIVLFNPIYKSGVWVSNKSYNEMGYIKKYYWYDEKTVYFYTEHLEIGSSAYGLWKMSIK